MIDGVHAQLRECWILASNRRESCTSQDWTSEPTLHALVVEYIQVDRERRQQGLCRDFLHALLADSRFELVVVECVQSEILAQALLRWGWECDPGVMDFYKRAER